MLCDHDWHPGVIGIVAGRMAEKYNRPVIMIAGDPLGVKPGTGSARSVPGFNLHEALTECSHLLEGYARSRRRSRLSRASAECRCLSRSVSTKWQLN